MISCTLAAHSHCVRSAAWDQLHQFSILPIAVVLCRFGPMPVWVVRCQFSASPVLVVRPVCLMQSISDLLSQCVLMFVWDLLSVLTACVVSAPALLSSILSPLEVRCLFVRLLDAAALCPCSVCSELDHRLLCLMRCTWDQVYLPNLSRDLVLLFLHLEWRAWGQRYLLWTPFTWEAVFPCDL